MKLTIADIKEIWYNISTQKIQIDSIFGVKQYSFGPFAILPSETHISVCKNGKVIDEWKSAYNSKDDPIYQMSVAVKNKANGKPFTNPYENMSVDTTVQKCANTFEKVMTQNASAIFPYNFQKDKQKYTQTISEMKQIFAQKIREKCK